MTGPSAIGVAVALARSFERCGVRYILGGSMASASYGEPRSTLDADFAADLDPSTFEKWADDAERDFLFDREWARSEVETRGSFQLLHRIELLRVDVFVPHWTGLDLWKWERRQRMQLGQSQGQVDVTSAEGIVLQKLLWYEAGGRTSDRQWRDIVSVLKHQRTTVALDDLENWATQLHIAELLHKALREAQN